MLLNPKAVKRLKRVTESMGYWYNPNETHTQRNELARMFIEEAGRLLDQKAEQTIKHGVELYCKGEISYERYCELIDQISREEEARGATQGGAYARNHVFDFAQKAFEQEKDRIHSLALAEAKQNYEVERQKADQVVKAAIQQGLAEIATTTQQYAQQYEEEKGKRVQTLQNMMEQKIDELSSITQAHEEHLQHLVEETKTEVDGAISARWQEETHRREQEIYEQEQKRPLREALRTVTERVTQAEKKAQTHSYLKKGSITLLIALMTFAVVLLIFFPLLLWLPIVLLIAALFLLIPAFLLKPSISEEKIAEYRRQITLSQTQSGDYTGLDVEQRAVLLLQKVPDAL